MATTLTATSAETNTTTTSTPHKILNDDEEEEETSTTKSSENKTKQPSTSPPQPPQTNTESNLDHETTTNSNNNKRNNTNRAVTEASSTNSNESQKEDSKTFSSSSQMPSITNNKPLLEKSDNVVDSTSLSSSSSSSTSSSSSVAISNADNNNTSTSPSDLVKKQLTPLIDNLSLTNGETTSGSNINLNNLNALQQQLAVAAAAALQQQQQQNSLNVEGFNQRASVALAAQISKSQQQQQQQQQKPMVQGWNQQTPWQQQQQLMSPLNTNTAEAKAAAAVWTNALNAATSSNIQQQQLQLLKLSANKNAQFNSKTNVTSSATASTNKLANTSSNTITQALNSMYSPSQLQKAGSNGTSSVKLTQAANGNQQRSVLSNAAQYQGSHQYEMPSTTALENGGEGLIINPEFSLNSQIIDLIKQNPSQIEQILKLKSLYQMGGDEGSILEELQQLDQTVPANLAIVAAVANLQLNAASSSAAHNNNLSSSNNGNSSRNSPRSSNYNQQQQNSYNPNVYNNSSQNFKYNQNQHFHQNQYGQQLSHHQHHHNHHQNSPQYHSNHQHHQQQQPNQHHHHHPNIMQLSLQQQQQLQQMQDYHEERFSRKVFVGGLPPDIDEDEIVTHFRRYGNLIVDWPHKAESKSYFPPKGYSFLIFQEERSVQDLIETCVMDDGKLYMVVSSPSMKDKPVQIRPWCLADSDFVMDGSQPLDPRKTIFVGGVPRPLKAIELAMIMDRFYGGVCYAGIDTDPELKYPKGAGRVAFSNQQSYIAAISARFVQLQHGEIDKRVEVKPYVLDDQLCDECQGARCGGKFAPFFCANVTCLQYYCEACWATIHTRPGREYHKPLVKEGADRPRPLPYK